MILKGDAVGGTMRNRIGALGQEHLIRAILSSMTVRGIRCYKASTDSEKWKIVNKNDVGVETDVKALYWKNSKGGKVLIFNSKIPTVNKNVDISLFSCKETEYNQKDIVCNNPNAIMFGELKSGIDPAGADEHWKTGNSALNRIRESFAKEGFDKIKTSFIAAAIEQSMAKEIFEQLQKGVLTNATNLTNNNQLIEYCNWLIEL